jgi:hypothetical protein
MENRAVDHTPGRANKEIYHKEHKGHKARNNKNLIILCILSVFVVKILLRGGYRKERKGGRDLLLLGHLRRKRSLDRLVAIGHIYRSGYTVRGC